MYKNQEDNATDKATSKHGEANARRHRTKVELEAPHDHTATVCGLLRVDRGTFRRASVSVSYMCRSLIIAHDMRLLKHTLYTLPSTAFNDDP